MFAARLSVRKNDTNVKDCSGHLICLSFPGPWVRDVRLADTVPVLMQFESLLILVHLVCGANEARQHTIPADTSFLHAQWLFGERQTVPWPVKATTVRYVKFFFNGENRLHPVYIHFAFLFNDHVYNRSEARVSDSLDPRAWIHALGVTCTMPFYGSLDPPMHNLNATPKACFP